MYRISVTSLEAFRRFRDKHSIWDTEERVLNTLSGKKGPNAYAAIGSVFHSIVETGKAIYVGENTFKVSSINSIYPLVSDSRTL